MPGGRPRGGRRQGAVGTAYPQRSDLNGGKMPVTATPGGTYGDAKASMDAQRAVPMATPEVAGGWHPSQGRPATMPAPGSLGDLFAPSTDPNEHVMNGAALGPGLGPEAFGNGNQDKDLARMVAYLPALSAMANRPGASAPLRDLVRSIKAAAPGTGTY